VPEKIGSLFKISKLEHNNSLISATLDIDKDSDILKGHFPGQPVIPGACMLQIVRDVLEEVFAVSLRLKRAEHLKFIAMIDPVNPHTLQLNISYKNSEDALNVTAKLINGEVISFKFQGTFIKQ